eukprot:scaffold167593_cov19-Tisochrysis_lutea.AAC.2
MHSLDAPPAKFVATTQALHQALQQMHGAAGGAGGTQKSQDHRCRWVTTQSHESRGCTTCGTMGCTRHQVQVMHQVQVVSSGAGAVPREQVVQGRWVSHNRTVLSRLFNTPSHGLHAHAFIHWQGLQVRHYLHDPAHCVHVGLPSSSSSSSSFSSSSKDQASVNGLRHEHQCAGAGPIGSVSGMLGSPPKAGQANQPSDAQGQDAPQQQEEEEESREGRIAHVVSPLLTRMLQALASVDVQCTCRVGGC